MDNTSENSSAPQPGFISKGVAHVALTRLGEAEHFVFVLLPGLSMAAFSSALEPLRIANQLAGKELYTWETMSDDGAPVRCSNRVTVAADGPVRDPDGRATILVCSGVEPEKNTSDKIAAWIRKQWRSGQIVGGLCTGAYTLARAGILQGHRFALHWENETAFTEHFPTLKPEPRIYTIDRRILSSSGGSSSTDLILKLILTTHGPALFQPVMDMCLHPYHREEDATRKTRTALSIGSRNPKLIAIIDYMEKHLDEDLDMGSIAALHNISRRQMERLFKSYTDKTPAKYLKDQRLSHGRTLLAETGLSVADVALASGYGNRAMFSREFKKLYGVSPHRFTSWRSES
ncbi:GlxA family transcriptional regulator [Candidatus Halocynthiibacter alkanivorans]|uniref:GlxA family transcriptional regulator n=1 Tax=Candidatus Halocynthiibacter alkanivorans TaxID=2267619 RepID=UPI00135CC4EC|nr:GlxA family transcriptional regulator [Candidatus Halocynthiibacter alkanivorans]